MTQLSLLSGKCSEGFILPLVYVCTGVTIKAFFTTTDLGSSFFLQKTHNWNVSTLIGIHYISLPLLKVYSDSLKEAFYVECLKVMSYFHEYDSYINPYILFVDPAYSTTTDMSGISWNLRNSKKSSGCAMHISIRRATSKLWLSEYVAVKNLWWIEEWNVNTTLLMITITWTSDLVFPLNTKGISLILFTNLSIELWSYRKYFLRKMLLLLLVKEGCINSSNSAIIVLLIMHSLKQYLYVI